MLICKHNIVNTMTNRTLQRQLFTTGCFLAGLAVMLGAFGSHALKERLTPDQLNTFEVGVRYQFMHALVLVILAIALRKLKSNVAHHLLYSFTSGIIVFSFSLYLISMKSLLNLEYISFIGAITPLGGLTLIVSWFYLGFYGLKPLDVTEDAPEHRNGRVAKKPTDQ